MTKISAVIPVRKGSRRLPNKNILPFGTSNLLIHKIRQLKQVKGLDEVVVSSDSDEMLEMARNENVKTHKREPQYCDDISKTFNEVIENVAQNIDCDILMWTPCVCPLVEIKTYEAVIEKYKELIIDKKEYDSLVTAKIFKEYLWNENGPINYNFQSAHVISQNLPDWYVLTNGIYMMDRNEILKTKYFIGKNPYKFILSKQQAVDIDDVEDFKIAKALLGMKEDL